MEWTKLRSVRSTAYSFAAFAVLSLGLSALFTWLNVRNWHALTADQRMAYRLDPTGAILGAGFFLGQLAICVLGIMVITSEYSTGMIRASLLAVPSRGPLLAAKGLVFAAATFVVGEVVSLGAFFIDTPILRSRVQVGIGDPGVLRALIGGGLYLAVLGVFAMSIGAVVRHTAGGITGVVGFVLVLAPLAQLLPGSLGKHIHAYLPSEAGQLIAQSRRGANDLLSPIQGFAVFCLWTAALWLLAWYLLKRRDA
jgi:ABC-type transport system involved in multi-copper enzyme maturation permease subunit